MELVKRVNHLKIEEIKNRIHGREPGIMGSDRLTRYAVLLPIIEKNEELHILFEVRSFELRRQPGEICFPGGKVDPKDIDERHTAIRETCEELGISEKDIADVTPLDYMVNPFGTIIYPFVGYLHDSSQIIPNPDEVAEVFTVPLTYLQNTGPDIYQIDYKLEPEGKFPFHHIIGGEKYKWQARSMEEHFYYYEDKVIWGLTARILTHFLQLIETPSK